MKYKELGVVVLDKELPDLGLRRGDLGTVVHVYGPEGVEVVRHGLGADGGPS